MNIMEKSTSCICIHLCGESSSWWLSIVYTHTYTIHNFCKKYICKITNSFLVRSIPTFIHWTHVSQKVIPSFYFYDKNTFACTLKMLPAIDKNKFHHPPPGTWIWSLSRTRIGCNLNFVNIIIIFLPLLRKNRSIYIKDEKSTMYYIYQILRDGLLPPL